MARPRSSPAAQQAPPPTKPPSFQAWSAAAGAGELLPPTAAAVAVPVAGALGTAAAAKALAGILSAFDALDRKRRPQLRTYLIETLTTLYPERSREEILRFVRDEIAREREFYAKQRQRIERDLDAAVKLDSAEKRRIRIQQILDREKRWIKMREQAALERAAARTNFLNIKDASPEGAYWMLGQARVHTPSCIAMAAVGFWPWEVLDVLHPQLHAGCVCHLISKHEAVTRGLMHPDQVPDVGAALRRAAEIAKLEDLIMEVATPQEIEDYTRAILEAPYRRVHGHRTFLRYAKGTHEGGKFMPRGGVGTPILGRRAVERALRNLIPHAPRSMAQRRAEHAGEWKRIAGREVFVPEHRAFEREIGGRRWYSPPGSTEVHEQQRPNRAPALTPERTAEISMVADAERSLARSEAQLHRERHGTHARPTYPVLDRPPKDVPEFLEDIRSIANELGTRTSYATDIPRVRLTDKISDTGGLHTWDGEIALGPDVDAAIKALVRSREEGRTLDWAEAREVYAAYKTSVHEAEHAVNPMSELHYVTDPVLRGIEEALAEELAGIDTVEVLRRQGLYDVLAWAKANPTDYKVEGSYSHYRTAMDKIFGHAGVPPEEREEALRTLKNVPPGQRYEALAAALAAGAGVSQEQARQVIGREFRPAAEKQEEGDEVIHAPNIRPDLSDIPDAEPALVNGQPVYEGTWLDLVPEPGEKFGKTGRVVRVIRTADGPLFDLNFGPFTHAPTGTAHAVHPDEIVRVRGHGEGRAGAQQVVIDGLTYMPGDTVSYVTGDGRTHATLDRIIRVQNFDLSRPEQGWQIEATTDAGVPVLLTKPRTPGLRQELNPHLAGVANVISPSGNVERPWRVATPNDYVEFDSREAAARFAFKQAERSFALASPGGERIPNDQRVYIAEGALQRGGLDGGPMISKHGHIDTPEQQAENARLSKLAQEISGDPTLRVVVSNWIAGPDGSMGHAVYNRMSHQIAIRPVSTKLTFLHEIAHAMTRATHADGHDQAFMENARDLYAKHLSPEAAEVFWNLLVPSGSSSPGGERAQESRVTSWHLTDNPKFAFDPERVGQVNSTLGGEMSEPGLFVTQNPEFWINRHDYVRPFIAEIEHPVEVESGYYEGRDQYLPARLYGRSEVKRLIPLDEWVRETYHAPGWIEVFHGEASDYDKFPEYRYEGPDVREMPPDEVQRHMDRATAYIEGGDRKWSMLRQIDDQTGDYAVGEEGEPLFDRWQWGYTASGKLPGMSSVGGERARVPYPKDLSEWRLTELVPVEEMMRFRDAVKTTTPEKIDRLREQISRDGMKDPIWLDHAVSDGRTYISEGNNRLEAAAAEGFTHVPVRVVTVRKVHASHGGAVIPSAGWDAPQYARPSEIGLAALPLPPIEEASVAAYEERLHPRGRGGKWVRKLGHYVHTSGGTEIHDNGGGLGPAKGSGRWAVMHKGKHVANVDTLKDAKEKAERVMAGKNVRPTPVISTETLWRRYAQIGKRENVARAEISDVEQEILRDMIERQREHANDAVSYDDIRGEQHVHSEYSDGHNTLSEIADEAMRLGHAYVVISDHARDLDADKVARQHAEIDQLNVKLRGKVRLVKGIEADIAPDGTVVGPKGTTLDQFEHVNAGVHEDKHANATERLLNALDEPSIQVLAHPHTSDDVDYDAVARKAAEKGVTLELNGRDLLRNSREEHGDAMVDAALKYGVRIQIASDAHQAKTDFTDTRYAVKRANKRGVLARHLHHVQPSTLEEAIFDDLVDGDERVALVEAYIERLHPRGRVGQWVRKLGVPDVHEPGDLIRSKRIGRGKVKQGRKGLKAKRTELPTALAAVRETPVLRQRELIEQRRAAMNWRDKAWTHPEGQMGRYEKDGGVMIEKWQEIEEPPGEGLARQWEVILRHEDGQGGPLAPEFVAHVSDPHGVDEDTAVEIARSRYSDADLFFKGEEYALRGVRPVPPARRPGYDVHYHGQYRGWVASSPDMTAQDIFDRAVPRDEHPGAEFLDEWWGAPGRRGRFQTMGGDPGVEFEQQHERLMHLGAALDAEISHRMGKTEAGKDLASFEAGLKKAQAERKALEKVEEDAAYEVLANHWNMRGYGKRSPEDLKALRLQYEKETNWDYKGRKRLEGEDKRDAPYLWDMWESRYSYAEEQGVDLQGMHDKASEARMRMWKLEEGLKLARSRAATLRRDTAYEVLKEIRPFGSTNAEVPVQSQPVDPSNAEDVAARDKLDRMTPWLPTDWIKDSDEHERRLFVSWAPRGKYRHNNAGGVSVIVGSSSKSATGDIEVGGGTMLHEMVHRIEEIRDGVEGAEWTFYVSRVSPEINREWLPQAKLREVTGISAYEDWELTREDDFVDAYSGKTYGDDMDSSYEILTMGIENLVTGEKQVVETDEEYRQFVLAALAVL